LSSTILGPKRRYIIFQSYFIRNYLCSFLGGQIINLAATIGFILRGNQGRTSLDLYQGVEKLRLAP
jgi:hypothetical protein